MQAARPPLLRGAILLIALAAIAFIMARGDNPAAATSYNPHNSVSISDPSPGANADISIQFSVDAPDSFPNVKTDSTIQFIPRQWDIADDAPIGGIGGSFDTLSTLGIFGGNACFYTIPVDFTMIDATTDTGYNPDTGAYDPQKLASDLDLGEGKGPGGTDAHPGGPGYSGQFMNDPLQSKQPGDVTDPPTPLRAFNANEMYGTEPNNVAKPFDGESMPYRDVDGSRTVTFGDVRLIDYPPPDFAAYVLYPAGSVVQPGDNDGPQGTYTLPLFPFNTWLNPGVKHSNPDGNGQMDAGENVYKDIDYSGTVSYGDIRLYKFGQLPFGSTVAEFALPGGVTRYPDFLNLMFPPDVVGNPLARQWGGQMVLLSAVSLNIVTFRPGQLPGYPATLGYPNVVVLLNPPAPIDVIMLNVTNDLCTPLSLTSTNFGVSKDNPSTLEDEGGHARLTNPRSEKSHDFTLVTTSQPDADNDGLENMLDTCPLDPNIDDLDARLVFGWRPSVNPDLDDLDGACDPVSYPPSDLGAEPLVLFDTAKEFHNGAFGNYNPTASFTQAIYRDLDGSLSVSAGDLRLTQWRTPGNAGYRAAGTTVMAGDEELTGPARFRQRYTLGTNEKYLDSNGNGQMDPGEGIYRDVCYTSGYGCDPTLLGDVSIGDMRLFTFEGTPPTSQVLYHSPSPEGPVFYNPDEDLDNYPNGSDNCATVPNGVEVLGMEPVYSGAFSFWVATLGDLIGTQNQNDTDGDNIGDACDPDPYTVTGHMHVVTLTQGVPIFKHGIKLSNLGGPPKDKDQGPRTYSVDVSNLSASENENVQVALRVVGGCGTVNGAAGQNKAVVTLAPGASGTADFTVDWTGCAAGDYVVQADACHGGDVAPAGFFGSGNCPGYAGHGELVTGVVPLASATASSEYSSEYSAAKAIDGTTGTSWCSSTSDANPVLTVYTGASASIDGLDISSEWAGESFRTGTITMSNGYSQGITLSSSGAGSFTFPAQTGIEWVRFTSATKTSEDACMSEFKLNGSWFVAPPDPNPLDDAPIAQSVEVGSP